MSSSPPPFRDRKTTLGRWASRTLIVTLLIPTIWMVLVQGLGGNLGLLIGWYTVLPILLITPLGFLLALALTIGWIVTPATDQSARSGSLNPGSGKFRDRS